MKYLLLEHWTDLSEVYPRISVHDTPEARDKATLAVIFSEDDGALDGHEDEAEKHLRKLRDTGSLSFEGDPGLSWITCEYFVSQDSERSDRWQKRAEDIASERGELFRAGEMMRFAMPRIDQRTCAAATAWDAAAQPIRDMIASFTPNSPK